MRKLKLYFRLFRVPLALIAISILAWFYIPNTVNATQGGLVGSILGVGISIATAASFEELRNHKRRKRTFGLLKLVTIPYLDSRAKSLTDTMKGYNDIDSFGKAIEFLTMSSHLDMVAQSFDKEWFQLIYSQDFLDAINSDTHFGALAASIREVLLTVDQLTSQAVNAKINLGNDFTKVTDDQKDEFIKRARQIRDSVADNALKLQKYTDNLDHEIMVHLQENGASYSEVDR